jgi:Xaa-Pro aminopeptidase
MIVIERSDGMLNFETITFVPFDLRLVDKALLTEAEANWINQYHSDVFSKLSPLLKGDDLGWLERSTVAI